ncbi:MAG: (Fe-S)-binding protein [Desulfotignum sp.]
MPEIRRVTLFVQCLVDAMAPAAAEAMVDLFGRLGIDTCFPEDQTCCGQPAFNAGYRTAAATAARHFIEVFENAECIVCPSGSCTAMVRHHYRELFARDPGWLARAEKVGKKTFEFTEFLVDVLGIIDVGAAYPGRVTYHDSCHLLRTLGIGRQPRQLLSRVRGLTFVEMAPPDRCCGFGGSFSVKYPEISTALVADKAARILETGADTVTGCDMGCLLNIEGYLTRAGHPVQVRHIAELLAPQK